jgi:hypothetical protein
MGGGLLQLVAYGAQDAYLSGNPHITFWKILYKRHTNFAMEAFRVNFTGAPVYGQRLVATVNRNADLVWKTYVEITLPNTDGTDYANDIVWSAGHQRRLGYALLQQIEVEIGGQIIDRHYGEWLYLWETLTADYNTAWKLDRMVGGEYSGNVSAITTADACGGRPKVLYVPLQFWFNRNPGLALPLIALQYHEVRFNITLNDAVNLVSANTQAGSGKTTVSYAATQLPALKDIALYIDYIYLDVEERRRFAQESHEYLIEQLQFEGQQQITTSSGRLDLTLNHPVKELIWVFQDARLTDCGDTTLSGIPISAAANGGTGGTTVTGTANAYVQPFTYSDIVNRARLQINGQDRFDERYGDYFWKVQPYQHHTAGGTGAWASDGSAGGTTAKPINVYSFAIQPEEHQPSGTCNFSRIDNATLVFDSVTSGAAGTYPSKAYPYNFRVYAVNYNVFRIMSGMGGLAYSN